MGIKLYELSEAFLTLQNMVDEQMPDADILTALSTIQGDVETKAVSIADLIKGWEAEVSAITIEQQRLAKRKQSRENAIDHMKQYLYGAMNQMKLKRIATPTMTIAIQANKPSVKILDKDKVPGKFCTMIPEYWEVDKKAIAKAIKEGEKVDGVEMVESSSLRFR